MGEVGVRVVEGYYKCPVAFAVRVSALNRDYRVVVDGQSVTVRLPKLSTETGPHHGELRKPDRYYIERGDSLSSRPELAPFWGSVVQRTNDLSAPTAVSIVRLGIAFDAIGDDSQVRETARRIAEATPLWWSTVSAWIEVLYGQDLSRLGPVEPGLHFTDTTLWTRLTSLPGGQPLRDSTVLAVGSTAIRLTMPNYAPINEEQLDYCFNLAQRCGLPETAWLFIRDARSLCAGEAFRRALLDAGLAAELAVTQLITTHLNSGGMSASKVKRELNRNSMLSRLCDYWTEQCGGSLPVDYASRLIARRNAATHKGREFSDTDARDAVSVAAEIVGQAFPLP